MILYTMVPHEVMFPDAWETYRKQQMIEIEGGMLIVEELAPSEYKIVRLISGNPMHYLQTRYSPGTVIQAKPQL
ncbi:YlzJ-like family protein [Halalkalibacterium ligniniphilum]|uniref:YlzJ-like family protein n=1 Tax=Halalkalibacterium ligniniphilum TaxID=1134413 RepID=UPI00034A5F30|nr:YlzJ-like family protein [Halalkalibacterium ligniniphilum]